MKMTLDPDLRSGVGRQWDPGLASLRAATVPLIVRHARAGCWFCVVALMLYAVADFQVNRPLLLPLYGLLVAQLLVLVVGLLALNQLEGLDHQVVAAVILLGGSVYAAHAADQVTIRVDGVARVPHAARRDPGGGRRARSVHGPHDPR